VEYLTGQSDDSKPISYTVSKVDDPVIFEMISICKNSDNDITKRLVSYAEKLLLNKKQQQLFFSRVVTAFSIG
jgi:hypothetical protein